MIQLEYEQAVWIHDTICDAPLIERRKLEGALMAPHQTVGGVELYPTIAAKAAKYVDAITRAHAFLDGNKRLAWLSCLMFLELNDLWVVDIPAGEVDETVRSLVSHDLSFDQFVDWVEDKIAI